jgi:hypothetical protein
MNLWRKSTIAVKKDFCEGCIEAWPVLSRMSSCGGEWQAATTSHHIFPGTSFIVEACCLFRI